jgi:hypothetical protein
VGNYLWLLELCKSKKEVIKALKEKEIDLKKKLEELKKQGLPTVITSEIRH